MSDRPRPAGPAPTIDLSGKRLPNAPRPTPQAAARPAQPLPSPQAAPSAREGLGERPPLTEAAAPPRLPRRPENAPARPAPERPAAEAPIARPRTAETTAGDIATRRPTPAVGREWTAHVPAAIPAHGRPRLAALLANRQDVRRALLVSEVLGPPVSMRRERS
jgi:translation initiation factor IF-2